MKKFDRLRKALEIALVAHSNQVDKGGRPYILHPMRVAMSFDTETLKIIGVLHDVIEDSDITLEYIYTVFGKKIGDAIDAISKRKGEPYVEYLDRVRKNPLALTVKFFDIKDNLLPERNYEGRKDQKYLNALEYLSQFKKLTKLKV